MVGLERDEGGEGRVPNDTCGLEGRIGEEMLYVEVKGTTAREQILVKRGEVKHVWDHLDQIVLLFLHGIWVAEGEERRS